MQWPLPCTSWTDSTRSMLQIILRLERAKCTRIPEPVCVYSPAGACLLPSCIWHSHSALQALVQQQEPLQRKPEPGNSFAHSAEDHGAM